MASFKELRNPNFQDWFVFGQEVEKYILIDYENVKPSVAEIEAFPYKEANVELFTNTSISISQKMLDAFACFKSFEIKFSGVGPGKGGPDWLDKQITWRLCELNYKYYSKDANCHCVDLVKEGKASFYCLSKDKEFDKLLKYNGYEDMPFYRGDTLSDISNKISSTRYNIYGDFYYQRTIFHSIIGINTNGELVVVDNMNWHSKKDRRIFGYTVAPLSQEKTEEEWGRLVDYWLSKSETDFKNMTLEECWYFLAHLFFRGEWEPVKRGGGVNALNDLETLFNRLAKTQFNELCTFYNIPMTNNEAMNELRFMVNWVAAFSRAFNNFGRLKPQKMHIVWRKDILDAIQWKDECYTLETEHNIQSMYIDFPKELVELVKMRHPVSSFWRCIRNHNTIDFCCAHHFLYFLKTWKIPTDGIYNDAIDTYYDLLWDIETNIREGKYDDSFRATVTSPHYFAGDASLVISKKKCESVTITISGHDTPVTLLHRFDRHFSVADYVRNSCFRPFVFWQKPFSWKEKEKQDEQENKRAMAR